MTVETTDRKQTFSGGQSALTFSFRTLVSNPEYIKVKLRLLSTGSETDLTYITDFSVSVNSDGIGGLVTVSPTYSTLYNYVVYRDTASVQEDEYDDFNQFPASTIENSLDRAIMIAQEQSEETDRTLRYPIGASVTSAELPSPTADAFLQWNSTATALVNAVIPDPSTLIKATAGDATGGTEDTHFMTAAKVKTEVENSGTVSLPIGNIPASTSGTLVLNSDSFVPTQKAVKTYVDSGDSVLTTSLTTKISKTIAAELSAMTEKTALVDNDVFLIEDSEASYAKKQVKKSNVSSARSQLFTGSSTFLAPAGITKVYLTMIGGGGAGGGAQVSGVGSEGGGGGSGAYVINRTYTVVAGNSYTVTVGAGGTGVNASTGNTGGTTTFDTASVNGGGGGSAGTAGAAGAAGTGGFAASQNTGGGYTFAGTAGAAGTASGHKSGGGGGSPFGSGASGFANADNNGAAASANTGAGGSGACDVSSNSARPGGAGGSGEVLVQW